ncbi:Fatty acid metabolism regulator protein [Mycolicibacterium vanbaalenii]|uniref:Fatty acid metabolism regulator protein n=1 Tax=Mycolicibacterium vanbaalenii TaxID=110539 RepID=A0A5S9R9A2_MYCVN|nr:TetR family transcriptional regulator [Mycolicibacterium vanbaalenii]CAA0137498.1 Fatty acid metabolism regulator protein [Mycolicibacterium vanbaalenii]
MSGEPGNDIGPSVRRARHVAGLSVRAFAERVNLSVGTISAIENGRTSVSTRRLLELADALGTTGSALLDPVLDRGMSTADDGGTSSTPAEGGDWRLFPDLALDPVLSAAIDAFVDTGYHGTSMRMLANRAGLSVPGIYHHYRDKQALLVQILTLTMSELHWRVAAAREEAADARAEIARIVEALALFHTHHRKLAFIGASEMRSLNGPNRRHIAGERTRLQHILDDAIDRATVAGLIDPVDGATAGRAIATMCTSLPQWFNPEGPDSPEHIAGRYVHFAMELLRANATPGGLPT